MEYGVLLVSSWKSGTQNLIQAQILLTHLLSNIILVLDIKSSEGQNRMSLNDLKNIIILESGSSIDIFKNPNLVNDIKRINQVLHIYTNLGLKTNQIQAMVPEYGKLCYYYKAISNIFFLTNLVYKYRFLINHTIMMLSLFTPIEL